ncbi:hypothetical protein NM688_g3233 [Phlebia brevispora]|uniref:Uncharacterized protein n=1 Tax=Phlebia brevispora TaxID=194682 RepID=A0ACC1T6K2_9APHY|nr:hypothetical protein NM688_g3233 [Phlebia brevispora]
MSYSLFINLTGADNAESYPATSVSKYLIELIGKDICGFRRNTQTSYRVVEQARAIAFAINTFIKRVEEHDDWDAFDKYTEAIDPLEASLFPLVDTVEKERDHYLTQRDSADSLISFIEAWDKQRSDIRKALTLLRTKDEFKKLLEDKIESDEDMKAALQHDDLRLLTELVKGVELNVPKRLGIRSRTVAELLKNVFKELKAIEAITVSNYTQMADESFVWSVKISMIVFGAMELIQNTNMGEAWIAHARSDVIWKAAHNLLTFLKAHLEQTGTKPTSAEVKTKYDEFLDLLQGSMAVKLPANYVQLMKHAGRIGRSYHSQALYLVNLCRELAKHFEKTGNKTAKNLEPLKEAINETITALEAATQKEAVALASFDLNAFETSPISAGFTRAKDDIKHCFEQYEMASEWQDRETKLKASIKNDKDRMEQFNQRLEQSKAVQGVLPVDKTGLIEVTVKVSKATPESTHIKEFKYSLRPTTRLTAIQWQASREQYDDSSLIKDIATKSYFVKSTQKTEKLGLDVDISSLAGKDPRCELVLVIGGL